MAQYRTGIIFLLNIINQKFLLMAKPPNGWRYAPHAFCGVLAGAMYFANENQQFVKIYFRTRTLPANPVHLRRMGTSYFTKETEAQSEYTAQWQTRSRTLALVSRRAPVVHRGFRSQ